MQFVIAADHPCLAGHFPGNPLVPGVVILEHVLAAVQAQAGSAPAPLRLPQVKFIAPLRPGQVAHIALDGQAPRWRFRVYRDDQELARGEVVAGAGA